VLVEMGDRTVPFFVVLSGEVQALRDLARSFRDGQIDLSEFLVGPAWAEDELERAERLFEEVFESDWGGRGSRAPSGRGRPR